MTMQGGFDIKKLRQDAHYRWLKPSEVFYILQKHREFGITQVTPKLPPSGSLFLFNRRVHRFFRKDGHAWQRKKDGRSVGEAHEHLKVGNVDALNCYYARGEQNPYFQRRCYWMLNPEFEHIVLVHYKEVSEGRYIYKPDIPLNTWFTETDSSSTLNGKNRPWYIHSDDKSGISSGMSEGISSTSFGLLEQLKMDDKVDNFVDIPELHSLSPSCEPLDSGGIGKQAFQSLNADSLSGLQHLQENLVGSGSSSDERMHLVDNHELVNALESGMNILVSPSGTDSQHENHYIQQIDLSTFQSNIRGNDAENESANLQHAGKSIEILDGNLAYQPDCYTEMSMAAVSNEVPLSNIGFIQHDTDFSTSVKDAASSFDISEKHPFVIRGIFPEQAYSFRSTEVFIIGEFPSMPSDHPLKAVFGDTEVPLQIIQNGVLSCQAPELAPGKVKLCITSADSKSCRNERDFEFLPDPENTSKGGSSNMTAYSGELELLVRLARVLLCGFDGHLQRDLESRTNPSGKLVGECEQWEKIIEAIVAGNEFVSVSMLWVLQELVKDKLQDWLLSKEQKGKDTCSSLSKDEKCVIHMISGLGFKWALCPLLNLEISVDFRDSHGWTALHCAARFGREEMVAALLEAGALAGAVTDPTSHDPVGKTPASIAASSGHKGLAGYLAEMALTSHLSSLTIEETEKSKENAASDAKKTVETIEIPDDATEDQVSLSTSLAAVRNAAHTAARILAAFRAFSFKMRQQKTAATSDKYGLSAQDYRDLSAMRRHGKASSDTDQKFHEAALHIQKKYRGWKRRRSFLTLRLNVVKIQAHVRGRQVRKKYKELLRCVNIIEKIMLRWRWGRAGLRGFHLESTNQTDEANNDDDDDILKVFRKQKVDAALDKDFKRVLSMVGSADARQQYHRMVIRHPKTQEEQCEGEYTCRGEQNDAFDNELFQSLPPFSPSEFDQTLDDGLMTSNSDECFMVDRLWALWDFFE